MRNLHEGPPPPQLAVALEHPVFRSLSELAQVSGARLYVVGGYVRDALLGRHCQDLDVVTDADGLDVARRFAEMNPGAHLALYENFGTALVRTSDWDVEFVGARRESYRANSRKPSVSPGSLEDDQLRRDFTINAMAVALHPDEFGQFIDPFGGLQDLQEGVIRTPLDPETTFSDDPLRMMRAVRFAGRFGFFIEPATFQAITRMRERMKIVSPERISEEMNKALMDDPPSAAFKLMFKSGLLEVVFPELQNLHGVDVVNGVAHKDNFFHTLKVLDNVARLSDDLWLRWSALLHDIAKPPTKRFHPKLGWTFHGHDDLGARMTPKIFARLRLPMNEKMRFVQKMVRLHLRPIALADEGVSDSAIRRLIVDAGDELEALMKLCRADITTRDAGRMAQYLANFDEVERRVAEVEERDQLRNWQPPVDGLEIMQRYNLPPGPAVGAIKQAIRDAILDGDVANNAEAARAFMAEVAPGIIAELGKARGGKLKAPQNQEPEADAG